MKNLYLILLVLFLGSCEKEIIYPSDQYPINKTNKKLGKTIDYWGEFIIIDAVMYIENKETQEKFVFNHFGPNKTHSSLRWGGSLFEIEEIIKDSTTYSFWKPFKFPGYGKFVFNGDTSKHYAVNYIGFNNSIIEDPVRPQSLLAGSARPFSGQTINYDEKTVAIQIQEMEGSIDGYNCRYWTQLTLRKVKSW